MEFVDHSQETTELAKALVQVQRQMSPALKDAKNPFTRSNYATLNSVMESCREALLNNNIWLCQYPVSVDKPECMGLMTKLTHTESGQWQASLAVVPLPKSDPQGMGSAITYARRYAITAMLGMSTEDDDGESAKAPVRTQNKGRNNGYSQVAARNNKNAGCNLAADFEQDNFAPFQHLPKLEGISYEIIQANDGRDCIIAVGDTIPSKEILAGAGFRWNPQRKVWWKYADVI